MFQLVNLIFFRHNISLKVVGGKCKSVTDERTDSWNETTLQNVVSNCRFEDIFNADDFGPFCECLPNKTYQFKRGKCSGGKKSKLRVARMATTQVTGEKLPMFIIGK